MTQQFKRVLLIPGPKTPAAKLDVNVTDTLAGWRIPPAGMLASCVPSPYAQAEMMAQVLASIDQTTWQLGQPVVATATQRQTLDRWASLVLGLVQGKLRIDTVSLNSSDADNFGQMLQKTRPEQKFLGLLRVNTAVSGLAAPGDLVGAVDPRCMAWCAPRIDDGAWQTFSASVATTTPDGARALQLLWEWREALHRAGLWSQSAPTLAPWMKGIEHLLHGFRPDREARLLEHHARLTGPTRLEFGGDRPFLVYLPAHAPGWAQSFLKLLNLRPEVGTSPLQLRDERGRVGAVLQLAAGVEASDSDGRASLSHAVASEDAPLAGLGALDVRDARAQGTRPWLTGEQGYETVAYQPLLEEFLKIHRAHGLALERDHIDRCPVLFPDAVRLAHDLLRPREGQSLVRYSRAAHDGATAFQHLPLHAIRIDRVPLDAPWPRDADFVIALPGAAPTRAVIERLRTPDGRFFDGGELRAIGYVLWGLFTGEAVIHGASVEPATHVGDGKLVVATSAELSDKEPDDQLYRLVGSAFAKQPSREVSENTRAEAWKRRATLQRFYTTWNARAHRADRESFDLVGYFAARAFVDWVRDERPLAAFGAAGASHREHPTFVMVGDVKVPVLVDTYLPQTAVSRA